MSEQQNYKNHVRYFPLFHFVLFPLLSLHFIYQAVRLYQEPGIDRVVWVAMSLVFILMILAARAQALKVQDRVIRLEEKLRYKDVLEPELYSRATKLELRQIIALRFASDDELPSLLLRTLTGEFATPKHIKLAIEKWKPDHLRV